MWLEIFRSGSPGGMEVEVVARCREGDPRAWELLVDRYSGYIYAIVGRGFRLSDHDALEDVFQEVLAGLFENLPSIRDDAALRFWIGQTARRAAIDRLRQSGRESPSASDDGLPDLAAEDPDLAQLDLALDVRAEVDALPDHCREVVLRFFIRDESYRTISAEMDIPPGTFASRISRCLTTLRSSSATARASSRESSQYVRPKWKIPEPSGV